MKVSTKGRYALRMMLDLALHDTGEPVRVKEIAARQEISVKYMEQIIALLTKAGYVKSVRGPQGGYRLTHPPGDYTLGAILRLTEGSLAPVECLEGDGGGCPRAQGCAMLVFWKKLDEAIRGVVDGYTLEDLMGWQRELGNCYII